MLALLQSVLGLLSCFFSFIFAKDVFKHRKHLLFSSIPGLLGVGFITNFLDTLGIGSFAQQTALFKFFKLVDDKLIPATLNVGNTLPTVIQAFIFMTSVNVDVATLVSVSLAAPLGAVLGAGVVVRLERRKIQLGMGIGLLIVGLIILSGLLNLLPLGGEAYGLSGWKLILMIVLSCIFGALQSIGIGFYAPCMALVYALGMHPITAFPLMMTATAMLMVAGSTRFIKENAYDKVTAVMLTIAGIGGVFVAAYLVKSLPLSALKWIVCAVVFYTAVVMFKAARIQKQV